MLPLFLIRGAVGSSSGVSLSGETAVSTETNPVNATTAFQINTDGTIDRITSQGGTAQVDAATDWIIPNGAASPTYEVRITNVVWVSSGDGEVFSTEAAVEDTWIAISSDRQWEITESSATGTKEVDFDFEIRLGAGATLASGAYTLRAITQI